MDVSWTPGIGMIAPGVRPWTDREEPVDAVCIGDTSADPKEIRIEGPGPLVLFVDVATGRICLPDLDERVGNRCTTLIEHASRDRDALT